MTTTTQPTTTVWTGPGEGRAWWFLGTLVVERSPQPGLDGKRAGAVVLEITIPSGGSPPLHLHHGFEDAWYLLAGEAAVRCGDQTFVAQVGSYVALTPGVPHTFRVTSEDPARLLMVEADDSFLRFVQTLGQPAPAAVLPPSGETDFTREQIAEACIATGQEVIGPSMTEEEAAAILARSA